jgi:phosphoribosylanthranilate isomerase
VKVCCIQSVAEVRLAVRYGVHAVGLVSHMPTRNGVIDDDLICEIAQAVPPGVSSFLLTSQQDPDAIIEQQRRARTDTLQLVDRMRASDIARIRTALPGIRIVQVVHVTGSPALDEAREMESCADALLLDAGAPDASARSLGGTGRVHNWDLSAEIVSHVGCPVFLAGGLGPANVRQAIQRVRPFGVDVCSGLRPDAILEEELLARFIAEVNAATPTQEPGAERNSNVPV